MTEQNTTNPIKLARRALVYCRHDVSCEYAKQSHESRLFFDKPCTCGLRDLWEEIHTAEKNLTSPNPG